MKIQMYFVVFCTTLLFANCKKSAAPTSCLPSNLQTGVLAFYPFSNGSLNDVFNNHSLSNTTTAQPSADRSGNPNCAFMFKNFPSGNAFLHIKNPIFLDNISELSISLWYMPLDTSVNPGMYQGLVQRDSNRACNLRGQWELGLHDCRKATFSMNNSGLWSDNSLKPCENRNYYTDKWHHIVVTFKNNKAQIFINGVLKGDNTNGIGANCQYRNNIGDLFIGRGFTGVIDDVILYNRELTVAEINQLQQLSPCCD